MDLLILEELGRERAPEQVTNRLREAIVSGLLQPGDRLMQEELAERLGVSRMPIREALRRLEAEGLVVLQPYRGALSRKFVKYRTPRTLRAQNRSGNARLGVWYSGDGYSML